MGGEKKRAFSQHKKKTNDARNGDNKKPTLIFF
jgi:hypothetical protein